MLLSKGARSLYISFTVDCVGFCLLKAQILTVIFSGYYFLRLTHDTAEHYYFLQLAF
ncbi:hypothetical protein AB3R30_21215 [Leptolyngbyaceae cyanobacterium UHCC 1019]